MHFRPQSGLGRLFTLEEHRRRGYAGLLTRYLCNRVAQSGYTPYVTIRVANPVSQQFFQQIGFQLQRPNYIHETFPQ